MRNNSTGREWVEKISEEEYQSAVQDLIANVKKDITSRDYKSAVNRIIDFYKYDFSMKADWVWDREFVENSNTFVTKNGRYNDGIFKTRTDFGIGQFTDFLNDPERTFGDLVRNIFHEYVHVQNAYSSLGRMEYHEDEFRAHMAALTQADLPAYSERYGQLYANEAEGYYNYSNAGTKGMADIKNMYGRLIHFVRPMFGLPAQADSTRKPPKYRQIINGKVVELY